jgi:hypothetical protein
VKRSYLKAGKKTAANKRANAKLKREFERQGITSCELGYIGCTRDEFLSWAHGKKRRKLQGDELETLVVLACLNCHLVIERMNHEGMLAIVESVIAQRLRNSGTCVVKNCGFYANDGSDYCPSHY